MTDYLKLTVSDQDFLRPDFEHWLRQYAEIIRVENSRCYEAAKTVYQNTLRHLSDLYGAKSRQVKYLEHEGVPQPPNISRQVNKAERDYYAFCEAQRRLAHRGVLKQKRLAKKQAEAEAHRQERAARLPLERELRYRSKATFDELVLEGFAPDTDFKPTQAISFARQFVWGVIVDEMHNESELAPLVLA